MLPPSCSIRLPTAARGLIFAMAWVASLSLVGCATGERLPPTLGTQPISRGDQATPWPPRAASRSSSKGRMSLLSPSSRSSSSDTGQPIAGLALYGRGAPPISSAVTRWRRSLSTGTCGSLQTSRTPSTRRSSWPTLSTIKRVTTRPFRRPSRCGAPLRSGSTTTLRFRATCWTACRARRSRRARPAADAELPGPFYIGGALGARGGCAPGERFAAR